MLWKCSYGFAIQWIEVWEWECVNLYGRYGRYGSIDWGFWDDPGKHGTFLRSRRLELEGEGTQKGKNAKNHRGIFALEYYGH
jgi:hypothetical protein